jgi:HTH-type transcriptional regulator/antitoxin HipB
VHYAAVEEGRMRIRNERDLGAVVRSEREDRGWSQQELADAAGVSKRWLVAVEAGKAGAEVGLVLRTLAALGVEVDVVAADRSGADRLGALLADLDPVAPGDERP